MAFRGTFAVESAAGARWDAALELLRDGQPITYQDVQLTLVSRDAIHAAVESAWADPSLIDRASADRDLDRAEAVVATLRDESAPFRELTTSRHVVVELVCGYGMGSVLVATRIDETTTWSDR